MHKSKSYLPELVAYREYLLSNGFQVTESIIDEVDSNSDIIWRFMGAGKVFRSRFNIHEYGSLSTGSFPRAKDLFKRVSQKKPDARIFLNEFVKKRMGFSDKTPCLMRDMGVHGSFFVKQKNSKSEHDFIYAGSITKSRQIERVCQIFSSRIKNRTLSLVGVPEDSIYKEFKDTKNIRFLGRVGYLDVGALYASANYGINFTPITYPFSHQTSTKLLEYCAAGLKIVSTGGNWVEQFMRDRGARFYIINPGLSNFEVDKIGAFDFSTPEVDDLEWNALLSRAGVAEWLRELTSEK